MKKINLLILHPGPIYRPDLPDIRDKYVLLSKEYRGVIISQTTNHRFKNYPIENFIFRGVILNHYGIVYKLILGMNMFTQSIYLHFRKERFTAIICYDPLLTGIVGFFLKYILRTKLIIEVNSNILEAPFLGTESLVKRLKCSLYKIMLEFSFFNADKIKLLYKNQDTSLKGYLHQTKIAIFPDFTPTHFFSARQELSNTLAEDKKQYLLFVGWPFYLKGVDILMKSFQNLNGKFPNFELKLIGHRLERDAKDYFDSWSPNISFQKGLSYDIIRSEFLHCYCFVLASRSEGMPRVIVEAMAAGKPIIASNVGGISALVDDGKNGFLFEKENIDDLTAKLSIILSNPDLAKAMGEYSLKLVEKNFSSQRYCENFSEMINQVLNN